MIHIGFLVFRRILRTTILTNGKVILVKATVTSRSTFSAPTFTIFFVIASVILVQCILGKFVVGRTVTVI